MKTATTAIKARRAKARGSRLRGVEPWGELNPSCPFGVGFMDGRGVSLRDRFSLLTRSPQRYRAKPMRGFDPPPLEAKRWMIMEPATRAVNSFRFHGSGGLCAGRFVEAPETRQRYAARASDDQAKTSGPQVSKTQYSVHGEHDVTLDRPCSRPTTGAGDMV
jgi:hypothetical protein